MALINESRLENSVMELEFEVKKEEVARKFDNTVKKFQKVKNIDGFRKGKAPFDLVKKQFMKDISSQVLEDLIKDDYVAALKEKNINPYSEPKVDYKGFNVDDDFKFKVFFDVFPTVELGQYKGLTADEKSVVVSEEDIQNELKVHQEKNVVLSKKDDGAAVEMLDKVNYTRTLLTQNDLDIEGEPCDFEAVIRETGDPEYIITKNLIGMKQGETSEVVVEYPADYMIASLSGKSVKYRMTIKDVFKQTYPAIDDDFVKDISTFETLEEFRNNIRKGLEEYAQKKCRGDAKANLIDQVLDNSKFDMPVSMIQSEMNNIISKMQERLGVEVKSLAELSRVFGFDEKEFEQKIKDEALKSLKTSFSLFYIAKNESIVVTEEKIDETLTALADRYKMPIEKVKEYYVENNMMENMKSSLLTDMALDFLYESAAIRKLDAISLKQLEEVK